MNPADTFSTSRLTLIALQRGAAALLVAICAAPACAATPAWKPDKTIEFIVPGGAGGGQDRTARVIQKVIQESGMVTAPVAVLNKTGGGGNLAYAYLSQFPGDGHYLATGTATLLTNHILGISPLSYTDFTPLSILYGEYIGFAVNAEGPFKTGRDLIERVKKDPQAVSFAFGTSRGNANHIAIALAMKAAGIDPARLKIVLYKASIEATAALMGGHVDVVATPTSTYAPVMSSGKVRIIAIAAPQRISGQFAGVPTWIEQGLDVVAPSHRMIVAPKGLSAAQIAFWDDVFERISRSDAWRKELADNEWENTYLKSADARRYLDEQYAQYRRILLELGLAK